jgi:membrane-bound lytic murein transglycosylase
LLKLEVLLCLLKKSSIGHIIRKERQKEYEKCKIENEKALKKMIAAMNQKTESEIHELKKDFSEQLEKKDLEIRTLRNEISKNHEFYEELRQREIQLNSLSADFETVIQEMNVKLQESMQPFHRIRSKINAAKRQSDKKDPKIQSIFEAM